MAQNSTLCLGFCTLPLPVHIARIQAYKPTFIQFMSSLFQDLKVSNIQMSDIAKVCCAV